MKKYFTLILLALLPMLANAYDAEIDGIYYNFSENEAEVTCGNDMYSGKVVIPEAVTYNDRNYSVTNIGSHAFYGCSALISIVIPNSVRTISLAAFYSSGLTSVNIPNSVTSIGNCAFADCRGLTSVTIGNSVTSIGGDAFSYCSCLIDVYCYAYIIPNTGSDVFKKTTISSATLHVLPYSLDAYKTTEPWSGFGNIVSLYENEDYACIDGIYYRFRGNEAEVSYGKMHPHPILVDPVEDLIYESYSYSGDVVIPESVTYKGKTYDVKRIGDYAFSNCRKLSSVTIPNSVIRIGDVAFYLCTDLSSITIPKSVTSIGNGAFAGCINMDFVSVESGNKRYDSRNNCNAIIETATNTLIVSGINTVIPNSVTSIGSGAFIFSNMNSITIPESVTSIGSWAFYGLCCLDDVYCLAEEVPETKIDAFDETYIDESTLHVPASAIEKYRTTEPWSRFGTIVPLELFTAKTEEGVEMAFKIIDEEEKTCQVGNGEEASINVSTDSLVNIPEEVNGYTVKAISSNSFYGTAIKEVTIPESVTTIASKAFGNNTNLETITSECTTPFDFEDDSFDDPIYDITIMNVPQASASAYQSSKTGEKFSNVQASSSSSSSATGRLFNAPVWKDHIMTFRVIDESSCQVGNGNNASVYTGTAESIKIPNNLSGYVVKAIGRRGFYKCVNLTRLYLDDNIEEIGEEAFYGCVKLRTLDLPKSVKIILNAFDTDITVNIHPGQEFLCDEAIGGDGNVSYEIVATEEDYEDTKEIHILASMKKISENRVYSYCRNIIKMWVDGGNPTYDSRNECNAIIRTADNKLLYGCQKTVIPNTVTAINDYAFEGHSHLSKIIIPAKVANIGEGAFADCTGLKEVKSFIRNPYPINDNTFSGKTYQRCDTLCSLWQGSVI